MIHDGWKRDGWSVVCRFLVGGRPLIVYIRGLTTFGRLEYALDSHALSVHRDLASGIPSSLIVSYSVRNSVRDSVLDSSDSSLLGGPGEDGE